MPSTRGTWGAPFELGIVTAIAMVVVGGLLLWGYLIAVVYPSALAMLIYMSLGYNKTLRRLRRSLRPALAVLDLQLRCPNCNAPLTGREEFCPNCHAPLRPLY